MKINNHSQRVEELSKIGEKISKDNGIPTSAFEEVFQDSQKTVWLFNSLRFGENDKSQSENREKNRKTLINSNEKKSYA